VFTCNQRRGGYLESSTHIQAALARCQSCLGLGCAKPDESAGCKGQAPVGCFPAQNRKRFGRNQTRLVETAIAMLCAMQRHRDHNHLRRRFRPQLLDRTGKELAELTGSRAQPAVFECVNQVAHTPFVGPIRNSLHKGRSGQAANTAQIRCARGGCGLCFVQSVATASARRSALDGNFRPAGSTNWNRRETREGRSAQGARCREDCATNSIQGTSKHAGHGTPSGYLR